MIRTIKLSSIMMLLWVHSLVAQTMTSTLPTRDVATSFHSWYVLQGFTKIKGDYSFFHDIVFRRTDFIGDEQQFMYRLGIQKQLNKNVSLMLGYAYVDTAPYGEQPVKNAFNEHRAFQQIQAKQKISKTKINVFHRYRLEQRFLQDPKDLTADRIFQNRARYLLRINIPLLTDVAFPVALNLYDEVFVNFGEKVKYNLLDQNRLGANINIKLNKNLSIEVGYMLQSIIKGALKADTNQQLMEQNHTMTVTLISDLDLGL
jgi:hypothetical protein